MRNASSKTEKWKRKISTKYANYPKANSRRKGARIAECISFRH